MCRAPQARRTPVEWKRAQKEAVETTLNSRLPLGRAQDKDCCWAALIGSGRAGSFPGGGGWAAAVQPAPSNAVPAATPPSCRPRPPQVSATHHHQNNTCQLTAPSHHSQAPRCCRVAHMSSGMLQPSSMLKNAHHSQPPRRRLVAHGLNGLGQGPHKRDARLLALARKGSVLRQEAVAAEMWGRKWARSVTACGHSLAQAALSDRKP